MGTGQRDDGLRPEGDRGRVPRGDSHRGHRGRDPGRTWIDASGAATLATALASGDLFDLEAPRSAILEVAHRAELAAETGQGDVFVQDRGGLVWNTGEGVGRLEHGPDRLHGLRGHPDRRRAD